VDDDSPLPFGWWGYQPPAGTRRSIVELIARGTLDGDLASLLWLLVEGRMPVLVASGQRGSGKTTLLTALLDFLPPGVRRIPLAGRLEEFGWLPGAEEFGWRGQRPPSPTGGEPSSPSSTIGSDGPPIVADPATSYLLAPELSDRMPHYLWGEQAVVALRALSRGFGLASTMHADTLEDVFALLRGPTIGLTDDEVSRLGVVLILGLVGQARDGQWIRRIIAAHLVRPVMRDQGGHVQRPGPAVLATWHRSEDRFDHFAWGVVSELAERVGLTPQVFADEQGGRRAHLDDLIARGVTGVDDVRRSIRAYQADHVVSSAPVP
jgi:hypothetical protein